MKKPPVKPPKNEAVTLRIEGPMTILSNQQVTLTLVALTANGKPATLDGPAEWATSNPAVASVHPDDTGWNCLVKGVSPGQTTITAIGDAALDPGVRRELTASMAMSVTVAEATTLIIQAGEPEDQ